MRLRLPPLYLLSLGILLFLWPVVLGFKGVALRSVWMMGVLLAVTLSTGVLATVTAQRPSVTLPLRGFPWKGVLLLCGVLAGIVFTLPLTFFSDEAALAIPSLTVLGRVAAIVSFPGLLVLGITAIAAFLLCCRTLRSAVIIFLLFAGGTAAAAVLIPETTSFATRYPPLVHVMQSMGLLLTGGALDAFRMPNVLWTGLLALGIFSLTPEWTPLQRALALLTTLLTPLGWTAHMLLYQACGEITFGIVATLLLRRILLEETKEQQDSAAALTGMLFSFWVLYRPTAIAILLACIVLLLLQRRRSACIVAGIAGPIALLWIGAYFLGQYQYDFLTSHSSLPTITGVLWNLRTTLKHIPAQMHPLSLLILLSGSLFLFSRKHRPTTVLLLCSWLIALTTIVFHQALLPAFWAGFARYNTLLVLPLAMVMMGLGSENILPRRPQRTALLALCSIALLAITPFDFISFTQDIRTRAPGDIRMSATGGDLPTPLPRLVRATLQKTKVLVILQPDVAYLDLFIAKGLLTVAERSALLAKERAWTPFDPSRPVLIQAPPPGITFQPNLPAEEEERLREAAAWARTQPGVQEKTLGRITTLIVP